MISWRGYNNTLLTFTPINLFSLVLLEFQKYIIEGKKVFASSTAYEIILDRTNVETVHFVCLYVHTLSQRKLVRFTIFHHCQSEPNGPFKSLHCQMHLVLVISFEGLLDHDQCQWFSDPRMNQPPPKLFRSDPIDRYIIWKIIVEEENCLSYHYLSRCKLTLKRHVELEGGVWLI